MTDIQELIKSYRKSATYRQIDAEMSFAQALLKARNELSLKDKEMAEIIGCSEKHLQSIYDYEAELELIHMINIAMKLGKRVQITLEDIDENI